MRKIILTILITVAAELLIQAGTFPIYRIFGDGIVFLWIIITQLVMATIPIVTMIRNARREPRSGNSFHWLAMGVCVWAVNQVIFVLIVKCGSDSNTFFGTAIAYYAMKFAIPLYLIMLVGANATCNYVSKRNTKA